MADTPITAAPYKDEITYSRQAQMPSFFSGSYDNDALYHTLTFPASGKGRFSFCVDNASSVATVCTLYGSFTSTGEVGDADVFAIDDTGITASATGKIYDTCQDPFPYYIVRTKAAAAGDAGEITVFIALMAF